MSNQTVTFTPVEISIEIPTSKVAYAQEKLVKLNRRLAKLGAPAATLTLGEIRTLSEIGEGGVEIRWNVQQVTITGVEANIAGWTFVASLDHTVGDGENLVARFPGHEDDVLPEVLRTAPAYCDHCGLDRKRNVTLVLRNEVGELRQIGKACAAEYLGIDPTNALNLSYAINDFADDDELRRPDYGQPPVDYFVAVAFEVVANFGFVRSRDHDAHSEPTVASVRSIVMGTKAGREIVAAAEDWDWKRGEAEAAKAIEWVKSSDDSSDYMYNLRLAVNRLDVHPRTEGLLASLPTAYQRHTGLLAERAARKAREDELKANATPVPITSERITITGTVVGTKVVESYQFGTSYKLIVLDDRGFKVFGSCPKALPGRLTDQLGKRITFQAKVERSTDDELFGFYSRPTRIEVLEPASAA
jgi:hypothetical protein